MQPISPSLAAVLPYTYKTANACSVWGQAQGQYQQLLPIPGNTISILSGSVTCDTTQAIRRTLTMTLADPQGWLTPQAVPGSALSPFGNEIMVSTGAMVAGSPVLVPMGIFALTTVQPTFIGPDFTIQVQGSDRGYTVGLRLLKQPFSVASGATVAQCIQSLIGALMPNGAQLVVNPAATTSYMDATTFNMGDNPWQDAVGVAANAGFQLYFDVQGNCQLQPIPDPSTQSPVWNFVYGNGSMIETASRTLTSDGVANDFIVVYEGTGTAIDSNPPIQGEYQDLNPASATYVNGPFGDVPSFVFTTVLQGQAAANAAAQQLLIQSLGEADGLALTTMPTPMLDGLDVIYVDIPKLAVNSNYVITAITTPLGLGSSGSLTVRKVVSL
ncbi:MAG: DUF5047 domain-containing protein [Candidatus Dormiibacterota bacterium]